MSYIYLFLILFTIAECTPEEAFSIVGDNVVYASGSPFADVDLGLSSNYIIYYF